ncbi:MAG: ATP-binding protein [Chloroflexota bacterium]
MSFAEAGVGESRPARIGNEARARHLREGPDLSIGQRLALGFGSVLLLLVILLGIFLYETRQIADLEAYQGDVISHQVEVANGVMTAYLQQAVAERDYRISVSEADLNRYRQATQRSREALLGLQLLPQDTQDVTAFAEMSPLAEQYTQASDEFVALIQQGADAEALRNAEMASMQARVQMLSRAQDYIDLQARQQGDVLAQISATRTTRTQLLLGLGALMLLLGTGAAYVTARAVERPAYRLLQAARALAAGDYQPALALCRTAVGSGSAARESPRDELRELADSFSLTAATLQGREQRLDARNRVSAALAETIDVETLGSRVLREVASYAGCELGVLYVLEEETHLLRSVASLAIENQTTPIKVGDGIPGQAAAARQSVVVRDIPPDTEFRVRLGFKDVLPRSLLAVPIPFQERTLGVLLLASLRDLSEDALDFTERSAEQLGVSLQNAVAHREIARLAAELREMNATLAAQNETLQAQQEEIQVQNEELQNQTDELQMQKEELELQREALLEADRLKDEFLSVASHELKGPITSLKGFTQLMQRQARNKPELASFGKSLAIVDEQANTLVRRMNRLLDASRARMGRLEVSPRPTDLVPLVERQVEEALVRTDKHRILLDANGDHIVGDWDPSRLEQVMGNLLDNAIRYSPEGGDIRVGLEARNGTALLKVADQGIGISPEGLAKLFQSYYREEAAKKVTGEGMGIGLYITKEIVAAHGGRVWVESEVGHGSTFYVELPVAHAGVPAEDSPQG